jgi:hypothetical protein
VDSRPSTPWRPPLADRGRVLVRRQPPTPGRAYRYLWVFACERQQVFFRRLRGEAPPWTTDPVIRAYRFTNAYRASDRVSQYLIRHVIHEGLADEDVFFRTIIFKIFNSIETWNLLEDRLGDVRWSAFRFSDYDRVLSEAFNAGKRVYSGAYIMPSVAKFKCARKHSAHLKLIAEMMGARMPARVRASRTMSEVYDALLSFAGIGPFLAYQYSIDLNYGPLTAFPESEFVVAGPGARSGIAKCFANRGDYSDEDIIRWVTDRQAEEFDRLGLQFENLFGRPLQLIDVQNIFCETDKYCRAACPEVKGLAGRTRLKQKFRPDPRPLSYRYPDAWGLNERVQAESKAIQEPMPLGLFAP